MAVEYEISSDVATIKDVAPNTQVARVVSLYSGQITYDDEAGSKFATATIDGKSQRVMLCIAVNGTVTYDDVPCLYSTVDGHRCLNIVAPTETGTPDDVPSLCETVVIDGMNVRAVRCILINETPIYDGVSSTCTFVSNGKTHTAQLVNQITGGAVDVIVKGVAPLSLPDAIANSLSYVKAFGGTEQNGTPTPDAPVDIVSNNGVLKVRHQSGLPLGYQPYEYITANGNKWLNTGVKLASTDIIETEFKNSSTTGYGALYGVFALGDSSAFYANGTYYGYDVANNKVNTGVDVDTEWHTLRQDFGNGVITLDGNDTTYTPFEFENTRDNYLFARFYNNSYGYGFKGSCKRFKVFRNGVLICDLIPVVQLSDNAIGMYDLVNNVFRGNLGTGDFDITNPINDLEIYADGTVETINANKDFLSRDGETVGKIINSDGTVSDNSVYVITAPCQLPAGDYTCTWNTGSGSRPFGIFECDTDGNIIPTESGGQVFYDSAAVSGINTGAFTISTPKLVRVSFRRNATDLSVRLLLGTATAEMLLKVGDYTDVQSILDGVVTRNVGVKVLTGDENFETATATNCYSLTNTLGTGNFADRTIVCSHFDSTSTLPGTGDRQGLAFIVNKGPDYTIAFGATTQFSTQSQWKDWLAAQSAAGTPVIVIYPLATPTTESVAGQTLQVTQGDNTLEITQASMSGLQLEAKYKAAVELTVQEVQDANLDPNVEVTIH
jgi:hypothetical protein